MVPRMGKQFARLVISLAVLVISLPAITFAATVPVVKVLSPVSDGIRTPLRIALAGAGNYYVSDPASSGVLKYNALGKLVQTIKTAGIPQGVAIASNGNLLVSQGNFVSELDSNGNEVHKLGSGAGQFRFANGIAVDSAGYIYVADSVDNSVKVFNASGAFVTSISHSFNFPTGIAYEKVSDQLAVVDTMNSRIVFFSSASGAYAFQKAIGTLGGGAMNFTVPQGVAFEYSKDAVPALARMYVVDTFQSTVQAIDPAGSGTFLKFIGDYGTANGQLIVPSDAVFDQANGRLVVVNGFGNLTLYGIDGGTSPTSTDTTPPALTIDPYVMNVNVPNITITGTREAGATVTVGTSTAATAVVSYPLATTWSSTISNLVPGLNNFTIEARDAAGNLASLSGSVSYTSPSGGLQGFVVNNLTDLTKVNPYVYTGTKLSGQTVAVNPGSCTNNSTTWSCSAPLSEGSNTVNFTVTGTTGGSLQTVIKLDTTLPTLVLSAVSDLSYTSTQIQNVTGTVTDANLDTVTVAINGKPAQPVVVTNGTFSFPAVLDNAANPANPANTVTVAAADKAGNTTTIVRTINFDRNAPYITVTAPADGASTKAPSVTVSGSVDRSATCTVNGNTATPTGLNWSANVPLVAGLNTIQIVCTDTASKVSNVKRSIIYDAASPELAINTVPPQDFSTNQSSKVVTGAVDASVTALTSTVNGVVSQPQPISGGTFSFNVGFSQEGTYAVLMTATDAGGKTSTSTRSLIYDVTPPTLTITPPVPPTSTIAGTVEPGATVVVKDFTTNSNVGTVSVTNNTWSANLGASFNQTALVKLMVSATDVAGNTTNNFMMKPDGDLNEDGSVNPGDPRLLDDARLCLNIVAETIPPNDPNMPIYLAHGDIGPLLNGQPQRNGKIDLIDCILIMRKAGNLPPVWW